MRDAMRLVDQHFVHVQLSVSAVLGRRVVATPEHRGVDDLLDRLLGPEVAFEH